MTQAFQWAGATTLASAILFVCGLPGMTRCMADALDPDTSAVGQRALVQSATAALQGNGKLAAKTLEALPRNHFAGKDVAHRRCILLRLGARSAAPSPPETGDAFVDGVVHAYQTYWWRALRSPGSRASYSVWLRQDLSKLLGESTTIEDWQVLEDTLAAELRRRGYYSQLGVLSPLRELMIWRTQTSTLHQVELPEGSYPVQLEVLSDFVSDGWNAYARCGRGASIGWATHDRLYAVGPLFTSGTNNDLFRASLLGHETQHFIDLPRFPNLKLWEREYRAKLTELWASSDIRPWLLDQFHQYQGDDEQVPHLFANKQVMRSLRAYLVAQGITSRVDLLDVHPETLRAAAREVLLQDSRARQGVGNMIVGKPSD